MKRSRPDDIPDFSVITVCYNAAETLGRCIDSVTAQRSSELSIQYIIVDGASTDDTSRILHKRQAEIDILISEKDEGIYDAMNKGLDNAQGRFVAIINADDALLDGALSKAKSAFSSTGAQIIHGNILKERTIAGQTYRKIQRPTFEDMRRTMGVIHPATFVARQVYETVGTFDTRYRLSADYDFILRAYEQGVSFSYLNEELSLFRLGGASNSEWRSYWETYLVHKRHRTGHAMQRFLMTIQCWWKLKIKGLILSLLKILGMERILEKRLIEKWSH